MNKPIVSKQEVLQSLTKQLRSPELDDLTYVKLLRVFGALQGWRV